MLREVDCLGSVPIVSASVVRRSARPRPPSHSDSVIGAFRGDLYL